MNNPLPKLPETAVELNQWIKMNFVTFEGPSRAYFELPINVALPDVGQVTLHKRVIYLTLSLEGPERDVVQHIAHVLRTIAGNDPEHEAIFVRKWFAYESFSDQVSPLVDYSFLAAPALPPTRSKVYGRLAFWSSALNSALMKTMPYTPDGQPVKSL